MKKIFILLLIVLFVAGGYFIFKRNDKIFDITNSSAVKEQTIMTSDGRIKFTLPAGWQSINTTPQNGGSGQFGPIFESFVITSFPEQEAGHGGIPKNSAKVDVEIQTGGSNLPIEDLVDCNSATSCEKIGIDSQQFIRAESKDDGTVSIVIATFYDNKILRLSAIIASGDKQEEMETQVVGLFNSITFSTQ